MSKWQEPDVWAKLCSGETCVICRRGQPRDIAATLEASWLTINEDAPLRGYACVVFQRHAVELHDLSELEAAAYMRDLQRVSRAVKDVTGAVKMNCEIHGNSLPHLHTHFYPRHPGDPFDGGPIDWNLVLCQRGSSGADSRGRPGMTAIEMSSRHWKCRLLIFAPVQPSFPFSLRSLSAFVLFQLGHVDHEPVAHVAL